MCTTYLIPLFLIIFHVIPCMRLFMIFNIWKIFREEIRLPLTHSLATYRVTFSMLKISTLHL